MQNKNKVLYFCLAAVAVAGAGAGIYFLVKMMNKDDDKPSRTEASNQAKETNGDDKKPGPAAKSNAKGPALNEEKKKQAEKTEAGKENIQNTKAEDFSKVHLIAKTNPATFNPLATNSPAEITNTPAKPNSVLNNAPATDNATTPNQPAKTTAPPKVNAPVEANKIEKAAKNLTPENKPIQENKSPEVKTQEKEILEAKAQKNAKPITTNEPAANETFLKFFDMLKQMPFDTLLVHQAEKAEKIIEYDPTLRNKLSYDRDLPADKALAKLKIELFNKIFFENIDFDIEKEIIDKKVVNDEFSQGLESDYEYKMVKELKFTKVCFNFAKKEDLKTKILQKFKKHEIYSLETGNNICDDFVEAHVKKMIFRYEVLQDLCSEAMKGKKSTVLKPSEILAINDLSLIYDSENYDVGLVFIKDVLIKENNGISRAEIIVEKISEIAKNDEAFSTQEMNDYLLSLFTLKRIESDAIEENDVQNINFELMFQDMVSKNRLLAKNKVLIKKFYFQQLQKTKKMIEDYYKKKAERDYANDVLTFYSKD